MGLRIDYEEKEVEGNRAIRSWGKRDKSGISWISHIKTNGGQSSREGSGCVEGEIGQGGEKTAKGVMVRGDGFTR